MLADDVAVQLAGAALVVTDGLFNPAKHKKGFLKPQFRMHLPAPMLASSGGGDLAVCVACIADAHARSAALSVLLTRYVCAQV